MGTHNLFLCFITIAPSLPFLAWQQMQQNRLHLAKLFDLVVDAKFCQRGGKKSNVARQNKCTYLKWHVSILNNFMWENNFKLKDNYRETSEPLEPRPAAEPGKPSPWPEDRCRLPAAASCPGAAHPDSGKAPRGETWHPLQRARARGAAERQPSARTSPAVRWPCGSRAPTGGKIRPHSRRPPADGKWRPARPPPPAAPRPGSPAPPPFSRPLPRPPPPRPNSCINYARRA